MHQCITKHKAPTMMQTEHLQKCLSFFFKINALVHDNKIHSLSFELYTRFWYKKHSCYQRIVNALNVYKCRYAFTYDALGIYNVWKMIQTEHHPKCLSVLS